MFLVGLYPRPEVLPSYLCRSVALGKPLGINLAFK